MPIAVLHIIEGRTVEQKSRLIASVTQAIAESLDAKQETVRVLIQEMPRHFGIGGVSRQRWADNPLALPASLTPGTNGGGKKHKKEEKHHANSPDSCAAGRRPVVGQRWRTGQGRRRPVPPMEPGKVFWPALRRRAPYLLNYLGHYGGKLKDANGDTVNMAGKDIRSAPPLTRAAAGAGH